jgi:hypothetical protein
MHAWRIKLIDVKYNQYPKGSTLTVGDHISEKSAYSLLKFGNAVVVDAAAEEIVLEKKKGVKIEENNFSADSSVAADNVCGSS